MHGTGGVDGTSREGQVRRSQLKHASSVLKRNANFGKASLTLDARLEEKRLKEGASKHLQKQRMMDPSYWCAPDVIGGIDEEGVEESDCLSSGDSSLEVKKAETEQTELTHLMSKSRGTTLGLGKKVVVSIQNL